jgi:hypothetical protein
MALGLKVLIHLIGFCGRHSRYQAYTQCEVLSAHDSRVMVCTCNPSTPQEDLETEGSPGYTASKILPQKKKKKKTWARDVGQ